ncbi:MAG TPA: 2-oxoacid:acceptor oxidoreductase subunit alpha, partial [Xanthomonadales bacterium]|nr:2-oxoacid:acceptor oxidoreductase subunit alpha [Xanthomonadales bacterium]
MPATQSRINDFVLKIATVNGTGSASANSLVMKALFRMGIPVTGKNMFPSNIQGLPTWYEIRANKDGYMSRSGRVDIMVAMNAQTYSKDLKEVSPGGFLVYDSTWPRSHTLARDDITILGVPLSKLCNEHFSVARIRILMKNIAYVGVLAALLDIDLQIFRTLLEETFAAKPKLVDGNLEAIMLGYNYAKENFNCPLPVRAQNMGDNAGKILIDGNAAAGLGFVYAGATVGAWYPITPSTSLMDNFKTFCEMFREDPETGEKKYCIIQAEDELAAAGMVLGANWVGARAFTPTSGPGISLMSEFIGFAYYAEIPSVFVDVQRVGPSTGMPTRTQQCDVLLCAFASHGDTRHPLLFPADPGDCFNMAVQAFDLAERLQTPVFMLTDLDIGMNDWMVPELKWDDSYRPDRGKVLSSEDLDKLEKFVRYTDFDGDGIPYRTLPGVNPKGAYFVRGSGHNKGGGYTEDSLEYQEVMDRLLVKWATAKTLVPPAVLSPAAKKTRLGVIAYGSSHGAVVEARDHL